MHTTSSASCRSGIRASRDATGTATITWAGSMHLSWRRAARIVMPVAMPSSTTIKSPLARSTARRKGAHWRCCWQMTFRSCSVAAVM